jgi:hypothetical protein
VTGGPLPPAPPGLLNGHANPQAMMEYLSHLVNSGNSGERRGLSVYLRPLQCRSSCRSSLTLCLCVAAAWADADLVRMLQAAMGGARAAPHPAQPPTHGHGHHHGHFDDDADGDEDDAGDDFDDDMGEGLEADLSGTGVAGSIRCRDCALKLVFTIVCLFCRAVGDARHSGVRYRGQGASV